jgi:transcriptional regulator
VDDAPADYIEKMLAAVVGIEIAVTQLTGKWKVSQNQPGENQQSLVQALEGLSPASAAMAALVRERSDA